MTDRSRHLSGWRDVCLESVMRSKAEIGQALLTELDL